MPLPFLIIPRNLSSSSLNPSLITPPSLALAGGSSTIAFSINPDISIILMCLGLLIACPVRIFQLLRNIDPVTGFYKDYESIMILVLYAVLGAASVFILLLSFLSARIPAAVAPKGRRIPLALSSFIFLILLP